MDAARFDDLARSLATATSRRSLVGITLGGVAGVVARSASATQSTPSPAATPTSGPPSVCANPDTTGLQDRSPGDLVAYEEVTAPDDPNFPAGARAWRVLYVSTGRDNTDRTLVCGVVVAPEDADRIDMSDSNGVATGRVVSWSHGTLGLVPRCQPSEDLAGGIWGATPFGINVVSWVSGASGEERTGLPENGILAGMIEAGWIVVATDYYADLWGGGTLEPFAIGKIEAANSIDVVRAAHHLMRAVDDDYALRAYDVVTWGHSQGGHAAMWTGQLLSSYATATATADGPVLSLAGVALEAPATTFITQPDMQPDTALGYGLIDWITHSRLQLTGQPEPITLGPFFLSYVMGAWAHYSKAPATASSEMPAFPAGGQLDMAALATPGAVQTIDEMTQLCWVDGSEVATLAAPYVTDPFLVPAVSDGPVIDGLQHGNLDQTCASSPSAEIALWCDWFRYNLPGPLGGSNLDKLPMRDGKLVPVLIASGSNDGVVHCISEEATEGVVPSAKDCPTVALYDALRLEYCPDNTSDGYLALMIWVPEESVTIADHSAVTGLVAARSTTDLSYRGSPLQQFFTAAFEGTLQPGCSASVVNAPGIA